MDIHNTARVKLEIQNGDGGIFAMVVTGLIAATVYVILCIMVASMHMMEQLCCYTLLSSNTISENEMTNYALITRN